MRLDVLRSKRLVGGLMLVIALNSISAATLPSGFTETLIASGMGNPTAMEFAPDGRLFVAQQNGQLRVIKNGTLLTTPFLTVTVNSTGERGLLGIAFDPNFAVNHYVYIYYTATTSAVHNRISRFTANGDVAVSGSETVILDLNNLSGASNHNGGGIHFGPDGKLYVGVGENATSSNAQTLGNLLGKMLRINPDGSIPTDNPFYNSASGVNRAIWALGLRNPFTFAIQPGTGRIFINDVGEVTWEEIDVGAAGANYGWPNCEADCTPSNPNYVDPIFQYQHGSGNTAGYAITGGAFYNPATQTFPSSYTGIYFFADYVNGWIRKLDPANGNQVTGFATGINMPVDLKVSTDGRVFYLARGSGAVYAISYTGSQSPAITQQPTDQTVAAGQPVTFTVAASGTAPLSYRWQRNGAWISGATSPSYTLASVSASDDGAAFRCAVTNVYGAVTSNPAYLQVTSDNPPVGTITFPSDRTLYTAGDTIQYRGTATDTEDGVLPASAFSWTIVFHHDIHTHPFLGPINGVTNGSFVIPTQGETSANVWYRINLIVTDSAGQTNTSYVDVVPRTSTVALATSPAGLQVTLDGQPATTPASVTGVVGMQRTLGVVSPQTFSGTSYIFASWSDGGAAAHGIIWPAAATTYTATYQAAPPGATLFADDFTRATSPGPLSPWIDGLGTWSVSGGMLNGSSAQQSYGYAYINSSWTDYSVEGGIQFPSGAYGGGLGGRLNPTTGAHYAAWIYPENSVGGSRVLKLKKHRDWTSWGGTPMRQVTLPSVGTSWHSLKMTFEGARIRVFYDGAQVIDVTDNGFDGRAAYLTGGINAGVWTYTTAYTMNADDIVVTSATTSEPTNQPPVSNDDNYSVAAGTTLTLPAPGVLANDTDADSDPLRAILVSGPSQGALNLSTNGSFNYTPAAGFSGSDSFTYKANDGTADSGVANVNITVTAQTSGDWFTDDFTRATDPGPLAPWIVASGTWSVSGGDISGTSPSYSYGFAYVNTNWTDYSVEGRFQFPAGAYGGGLGGRLSPTTGAHYDAWIYPENSAGGNRVLKLKKQRDWTSWSGTPMQQVTLANVGTAWHTVKMIFEAARIRVFYDGTQVMDVTDNGFDGRAAYLNGGITLGVWNYATPYTMNADDVTVTSPSAMAQQPATVQPAIKIESLTASPDGQFRLTLRAAAGQTLLIQASTDLESWSDLGTVNLTSDTAEFVDTDAVSQDHRYYRAKLF